MIYAVHGLNKLFLLWLQLGLGLSMFKYCGTAIGKDVTEVNYFHANFLACSCSSFAYIILHKKKTFLRLSQVYF